MKICSACSESKEEYNFRIRKRKDGSEYFYSQCQECCRRKALEYRNANLERARESSAKWRLNNPNYKKIYASKNRVKIANEPHKKTKLYKIKKAISKRIYVALRAVGSSKNKSITDCLSYTIEELKQHLESQFEPWMSWDNWGVYNANTWDDDNSLTWTWQIDHIIPHSEFKYKSMNDIEFKQCWSLSNLRPLSAKINILEGAIRIRHKNSHINDAYYDI